MKNIKTVYIASKMRGVEGFGFDQFYAVARSLGKVGFDVFNPAAYDEENGFDPETDTPQHLSFYMEKDLAEVSKRDAVVVFGDWRDSQGALLEAFVASYLGKPVINYVGWDEISFGSILAALTDYVSRHPEVVFSAEEK